MFQVGIQVEDGFKLESKLGMFQVGDGFKSESKLGMVSSWNLS